MKVRQKEEERKEKDGPPDERPVCLAVQSSLQEEEEQMRLLVSESVRVSVCEREKEVDPNPLLRCTTDMQTEDQVIVNVSFFFLPVFERRILRHDWQDTCIASHFPSHRHLHTHAHTT